RTAPVTTGTVSFQQGTTVLATIPLNGSGTATFPTNALPLGSVSITAVYDGSTGILGSTSLGWNQTVVPYSTTTRVTSSANPSRTVVFRRNGRSLGRARLTGGTAVLAIGRHPPSQGTFLASYQGRSRFQPSTSAPLVVSGTPAARARRQ